MAALFCGGLVKVYLYLNDEEALEREAYEERQRRYRCQPGTSYYGDDHAFYCVDLDGCQVRESVWIDTGLYRVCPSADGGVAPPTP